MKPRRDNMRGNILMVNYAKNHKVNAKFQEIISCAVK